MDMSTRKSLMRGVGSIFDNLEICQTKPIKSIQNFEQAKSLFVNIKLDIEMKKNILKFKEISLIIVNSTIARTKMPSHLE